LPPPHRPRKSDETLPGGSLRVDPGRVTFLVGGLGTFADTDAFNATSNFTVLISALAANGSGASGRWSGAGRWRSAPATSAAGVQHLTTAGAGF
jgi:hypothetical protein